MPDRIVELDGVTHHFPQDATDAEIEAALGGHNLTQSDGGGLAAVAAGKGIPAAARGLMSFGTSPTVAKTGGIIGRVLGAVAPIVKGSLEGPAGMVAGGVEAPMASWAGGKIGYFGTRMLQDAARPISGALESAAPVARILTQLGGAQGLGDLAQMAEPNRRDIGTLGVGASTDLTDADLARIGQTREQYEAYKRSHPPIGNRITNAIGSLYGRLMR